MAITYPSAVNLLAYTRSYYLLKCSLKHVLVLLDFVIQGLRPIIPKHTLPKLADLLENCWQQDPVLRPEFTEIIRILQQIVKEVVLSLWVHNSIHNYMFMNTYIKFLLQFVVYVIYCVYRHWHTYFDTDHADLCVSLSDPFKYQALFSAILWIILASMQCKLVNIYIFLSFVTEEHVKS